MSGAGGSNAFQNMSDAQLRQTITQMSAGASRPQGATITPTPGKHAMFNRAHMGSYDLQIPCCSVYLNNIRHWSNSVTPPPTNGRTNPSRKTRANKGSSLAPTPTSQTVPLPRVTAAPIASTSQSQYVQPIQSQVSQDNRAYPHRPPLSTTPQALQTTYPSRLRTGATLLMQPVFSSASSNAIATRTTRRGGVVNYADPGSGDEFPDAGALDSDDSDFMGGGGGGGGGGGNVTRTATRSGRLSSRAPVGAGVFSAGGLTTIVQAPTPAPVTQQKSELAQSYLGQVPPDKYITSKPVPYTKLEYQ